MKKSILSILALAGNKSAGIDLAARDLHAAIFHLCHAGQATPLSDTLAALPNRGKSAKIRAVISDYGQAAASYRAATKVEGKLDKSGRFVGLQIDNIPFLLADIHADLAEAVATVKKEKVEAAPVPEAEKVAGVASVASLSGQLSDVSATLENTQDELAKALALIDSQRLELIQTYARISELESAIESAGFDVVSDTFILNDFIDIDATVAGYALAA